MWNYYRDEPNSSTDNDNVTHSILNSKYKESNKKTSDEELIEIINPKKDEDTTDWYDKNKFKKILTAIDRIRQIKI